MKLKTIALHLGLFILTLLTTTLVGGEFQSGGSFLGILDERIPQLGWVEFMAGLYYSIPFLGILTAHEFGHYFVARFYKLKVTLPYYIPFYLPGMLQFGTFGAVIQIKSPMRTRKAYFDVGIAGPLAGFVIALGVLYYGFTHLPPPEHIYTIHYDYKMYGLDYANYVYSSREGLAIGSNLLFEFFTHFVAPDPNLVPNPYEIIHYPFLIAGYLACFFTALNLFPIGQLDGGHILFGLIGPKNHKIVSPILFTILVTFGGLGLFSLYDDVSTLIQWAPLYIFFLYFIFEKVHPNKTTVLLIAVSIFTFQFVAASYFDVKGYPGWLFFGFLLGRVLGVYHPPVSSDQPLSTGRKVLGWISLIVFILCFSPAPFELVE
ncbi:MAG: site-2 protease family protein [Flammeovirgaceae bacterium]